LDTIHRVATPEGCEIFLHVAGPVTRAQAWLYDFLLRLVGWFVLAMLAGYSGRFGLGILAVGGFLLEWFYPILFEVHWHGQTPGKRACGLAVLHDDGRPVGWGASFIRNTLRFVDFLPLLYATGFVATLLNADGKRLGDLAAGTLVVHTDPKPRRNLPLDTEVSESEPPPFPLAVEEQRAIVEYSRRIGQLTEERAAELAATATPLAGQLPPHEARTRLLRIANFLLGKH
jgi:uncharacterized RDD family membrane protein YckC